MGWLRDILGRGLEYKEGYERVRCDRCNGLGLILDPPGNVRGNQYRAPARRCGRCRGKGYVLVKKTA